MNDHHLTFCRRQFLRAAGVTMGLPLLDGLLPRVGAEEKAATSPRRMVCICTPLGLHPPNFFPERTGRDYELPAYLEVLKDFRDDFSVISGLSHPEVGSSHDSLFSFLTGAPHPEVRAGFRNTISLDQLAAEHVGDETRFRSLSLSAEGFGLSWTRSGALVPSDLYPAAVFARLFLEGRADEIEAQARRLRDGRSILDMVRGQAKKMQPALGSRDREKLDEYFTSVRELEQRMVAAEQWSTRPKPKVDAKPPENNLNSADLIGKNRLMFDLIHLALQTDSTRLVTMLLLGTSLVPPIAGVSLGHHDLSHHGQDPAKIEQLKTVELEKMKTVGELLEKLKRTKEQGESLLDRTMVLFSSNLGNASNHSSRNLPVLLAAEASSTAGIWPSIRRIHRRSRTCTCRCSSGWASKPTGSHPAREHSRGWRSEVAEVARLQTSNRRGQIIRRSLNSGEFSYRKRIWRDMSAEISPDSPADTDDAHGNPAYNPPTTNPTVAEVARLQTSDQDGQSN